MRTFKYTSKCSELLSLVALESCRAVVPGGHRGCRGTFRSGLELVMEHLVKGAALAQGAQTHCLQLCPPPEPKGWTLECVEPPWAHIKVNH